VTGNYTPRCTVIQVASGKGNNVMIMMFLLDVRITRPPRAVAFINPNAEPLITHTRFAAGEDYSRDIFRVERFP